MAEDILSLLTIGLLVSWLEVFRHETA